MLAEYPFQSKFVSLKFERHSQAPRMHYLDEGDGEPIVAVHGNPTWSFFFRSVIQRFRDRYRVIVPDHLGCGWSDKPQSFPYSLANHMDAFGQLMDRLGSVPVNLIVHDWGGAIALGWAVSNPDRVRRLVICNTAAFYSRDVPKRIRIMRLPVLGELAIRGLNAFAMPATRLAVRRPLGQHAKSGLLAPYRGWQARVGIARFVQDIPFSPRHPTYSVLKSIETRLQKISCPKLLLWGMRDFCFHPGFLNRWSEIYPDATCIRLPEAGHYLFEDEPKACNDAIGNFLEG